MSQATEINELIAQFPYIGYFEAESFCKVEIVGTNHHALIVMTELKNNPGTSITNRSERIAEEIVHRYGLEPGRCVFVEHYNEHSYNGGRKSDVHWSIVTYNWQNKRASVPEWKYITTEQFESLRNAICKPYRSEEN